MKKLMHPSVILTNGAFAFGAMMSAQAPGAGVGVPADRAAGDEAEAAADRCCRSPPTRSRTAAKSPCTTPAAGITNHRTLNSTGPWRICPPCRRPL